jgi:LmbE family N-acetylglucosaminyl deacetylase
MHAAACAIALKVSSAQQRTNPAVRLISMLRLLVVTAHPDDEAANFGGTLLHYQTAGVETHVICLTPGQAATHRAGIKSDANLAERRRAEFQDACRVLRVTNAMVLDYHDGQLPHANFYSVVADLTRRLRHIRPHVVLTYGPEGGVTAHTDHAMAGIFTTTAFQWAARSNVFPEVSGMGDPWQARKLYYATTLFTLQGRQPISQAPATACVNVHQQFDLKIKAFRQHATQAPLFPMFEEHVSKREHQELFHFAATSTARKLEWETDLFADIEDDEAKVA